MTIVRQIRPPRPKMQFWEGSTKQNSTFPETVKHKSCRAVIYHQQHRGGERFEVRYYDVDGSRLYMANWHSSGDWQFKQSVTMALPKVILKAGCLRRWAARYLSRRVAG